MKRNKIVGTKESATSAVHRGNVMFNTKTKEIGIVRTVDKECLFIDVRLTNNGTLLRDEVGMDITDCRKATVQEKRLLQQSLRAEGLMWHTRRNTLTPLKPDRQIQRGGTYYYLNEYFEICETNDVYNSRDRQRYAAGNYFSSIDEAALFHDCLSAVVKLNRK